MAGERLIEVMQAAAMGAAEDKGMADVIFGQVTGTSPLTVKIDNRFELDEDFLIVPRSLTDYAINITVDHSTEPHSHTHAITDTYSGGGSASTEVHSHAYTGTKTITIHNALASGDQVIMVRAMGGQKYLITDKVGG